MKLRVLAGLAGVASLALLMGSCGKSEDESAKKSPEASAAATPIDPATVGSIAGTVKLDGPAPKAKAINMAADAICAGAHATPATDPEVVVGTGGSLANVIVYVKDGLGNRTFSTPSAPVELNQQGCMYNPHIVAMMAGQTVDVKNSDKTTHNIHPIPRNNKEWNKSQPPGAADLQEVFAREEITIPVKCNVHPWMKSYIAVFKHPFFAVTSPDGSFSIKGLPPGTYTIEAWHERYGTTSQSVTIGPKEAKTISFSLKPDTGGD